jgi:hypothetical protein
MLETKHDADSDSLFIPYPFKGSPESKVRVPANAMVQGEVFVKARIEGWFRYHGKPRPGTIYEEIPDYQFDPRRTQPEG